MTCRSIRTPASAPPHQSTTAPTGRSARPPSSASSPMTAAWISTATSGSPRTRPTSTSRSAGSTPRPARSSTSRCTRNDGRAANAHGMARDEQGNLWFDVDPGRRSLGKLDPKTEKITVYQTPQNMSPLGGAVTLDVDGKGKVWASAPDGVVRFDPETEKFTDFKSKNYKTARGTAMTYGAAGDRDGNGWWTQMALDIVGKADIADRQDDRDQAARDQVRDGPASRRKRSAVYEKFNDLANRQPAAVGAGPAPHGHRQECRRALGRQFLGRQPRAASTPRRTKRRSSRSPTERCSPITSTSTTSTMCGAISGPTTRSSNYDPTANKWTMFELPVRGTEIRHISSMSAAAGPR